MLKLRHEREQEVQRELEVGGRRGPWAGARVPLQTWVLACLLQPPQPACSLQGSRPVARRRAMSGPGQLPAARRSRMHLRSTHVQPAQ